MEKNPHLLCKESEKARLEADNAADQIEYFDWVLKQGRRGLRFSDVKALHKICIANIYECGGRFRTARFTTVIVGGHQPAPAALIKVKVEDAIESANIHTTSAVVRAAELLWEITHIHPYAGGNGRTARALAVLLLLLDLGGYSPGLLAIPDAICANRGRYLAALKLRDRGDDRGTGELAELIIESLFPALAPPPTAPKS